MYRFLLFCSIFSLTLTAFAQLPPFDEQTPPPAPDYALEENWAALPFHQDAADAIPKQERWVPDSLKEVDVFYIHPTIYLKGKTWNAALNDHKINKRVDNKPVKFQASVFNASARVYAPRYRQAIVNVFRDPSEDGDKALDLAYQDVKAAFQYYLDHYNHGRPIIIASHSQGSCHSRRLLQEFFDTTSLKDQLVAAYVIGYSIHEDMYQNLQICETPTQTGCFIGWMSYKLGFEPKGEFHKGTQGVNPLTWRRDHAPADRSLNAGTVVLNLSRQRIHSTSAQLHNDDGEILWVKTKAPLLHLLRNLHIADYNLFWYDIRENLAERIDAYFEMHTR